MLESHFNKVAGFQTCNFIKKRLKHRRFSVCQICEIFKNTFLYRKPLVAASGSTQKKYLIINSFDPSVTFHTETSHLIWIHIETSHMIWRAKQMTFFDKLNDKFTKTFWDILLSTQNKLLQGFFLWILITMKSILLNSLILILWILCGKKHTQKRI